MKKEDNNRTPRLIRYGYLSNTVYFIPDRLSLTIRVDHKKEYSLRKRRPTKALLTQIQEDKEKVIHLFEQNKKDLVGFESKYDIYRSHYFCISNMTELEMLSGWCRCYDFLT